MTTKRPSSRTPRPKPRHGHGWQYWAKIAVAAGGAVTAIFIVGWPIARDLFDSGPLPIPSRLEVKAVEERVRALDKTDDATHKAITEQLKALADQQIRFAAQQKAQLSDTLTARLRNTQNALDQAKALYEKDASPANGKIVETIEAQLDMLQAQIRDPSGAQ